MNTYRNVIIVRFYTTANGRTGVVYKVDGRKAATFLNTEDARALQCADKLDASEYLNVILFGGELTADECVAGAIIAHINAFKPHHNILARMASGYVYNIVDVYFDGRVAMTLTVNGNTIKVRTYNMALNPNLDAYTLWAAHIGAVVATRFHLECGFTLETVKGA